MYGPLLSRSMLEVAKNEDEMRGPRGRWETLKRAALIMKRRKKRHGRPGFESWVPPLGRPLAIFNGGGFFSPVGVI